MDWDKVNLLLNVVHMTLGVPQTEHIRSFAEKQLAEINAGLIPQAIPSEPPDPELDLNLGARRI